jgi:outer membrane protein, heavy metal efflux system
MRRVWIPAASLVLAALFLLRGSVSVAQETSAQELEAKIESGPSQADFIAYAYQASPMVQSARAMWRATAEKYRVTTGLPDPRLMAEGMYMQETLGESVRPEDWRLSLTQMIPLPGRLGAEGRVVKAEAEASRLDLDRAVRDVMLQVRESYQELLYVREAKRVAAQNRELLEHLRKVGESAYAQNRGLLYDVLKGQAQVGQLEYDLLLLEELEETEKTRMNSLLNRPPQARIGPLEDVPLQAVAYPLEEIYGFAEGNREEIRAAGAQARKAGAMLDAARFMNLPELELGASLARDDGERMVGAAVGLTIPLWPGKRAGRTGQARAELESARAMRVSQINEARTQVRETYFRLRNSERLVKLYRDDLIPQAAKAIEAAETLYRQDQGTFADYLEAQSAWYNFQLSLARAKADQGKFLARLEALAGQQLTERAPVEVPSQVEGERREETR